MDSLKPVSYTHLDVYKRQVQQRARHLQLCLIMAAMSFMKERVCIIERYLKSQSYTSSQKGFYVLHQILMRQTNRSTIGMPFGNFFSGNKVPTVTFPADQPLRLKVM